MCDLHPTAQAVMNWLPVELRHAVSSHAYADDLDELISNVALAAASGEEAPFDVARSWTRRYAEGGNSVRTRRCVPIDEVRTSQNDDEWEPATEMELEEERLEREKMMDAAVASAISIDAIQKNLKVGKRRAYQIIERQVKKTRACGDLFAQAF